MDFDRGMEMKLKDSHFYHHYMNDHKNSLMALLIIS